MKVTIKNKEENKLLSRVELSGEIVFDAVTPSNVDLIKTLAKDLKVKEELIVIKNIYTKFSEKRAIFSAVTYKTTEAKNKYEMSTKHLRKVESELTKKRAEEEASKKEEEKKKAEEKAVEEKAEAPVSEEKAVEEKVEAPVSEEKAVEEKVEAPASE